MRHVSSYSLLACLAAFIVAGAARAEQGPERKNALQLLRDLSGSLEELSRRVSPAVVGIEVDRYGLVEDRSQGNVALVGRQRSGGSGVIVDPEGFIVTNAHVLESAQRVRISVLLAGGTPSSYRAAKRPRSVFDAKIVGIDEETDLALLKVDQVGLPTLQFGDCDRLRQGQVVLAVGNPLGLENSLSMGVVSSTERQLRPDDLMAYIQTDAPINPGSSGGPLINVEGDLLGINTFILSQSGGNEGIGLAIPSALVRAVYLQLRKNGYVPRGIVGASVQSITPLLAAGLRLPQDSGVIVADVAADGPADRGGLKRGDIVLGLDGRTIETARQFDMEIYHRPGGESVDMEVLRDGLRLKLRIPVVERPSGFESLAEGVSPEKNLIPKLGWLFLEIDTRLAAMMPALRQQYGVLVAARAAGMPAQAPALRVGDVVHAVNGRVVTSLDSLRAAIDGFRAGDAVVLEVERPSGYLFVPFEWQQ